MLQPQPQPAPTKWWFIAELVFWNSKLKLLELWPAALPVGSFGQLLLPPPTPLPQNICQGNLWEAGAGEGGRVFINLFRCAATRRPLRLVSTPAGWIRYHVHHTGLNCHYRAPRFTTEQSFRHLDTIWRQFCCGAWRMASSAASTSAIAEFPYGIYGIYTVFYDPGPCVLGQISMQFHNVHHDFQQIISRCARVTHTPRRTPAN